MSAETPVAELLFSAQDATPMSTDEATVKPWSDALECLQQAPKAWLTTVRPTARPHSMPVLPVLTGGKPCLTTRPTSLKARNLDRNPHCLVTIASDTLDLVIEGVATKVRGAGGLQRASAAFKAKYGWDLTVHDGLVHDHNLPGSPEYCFYEVLPTRAFGYGVDGLTATRWRF